MDQMPDRLMMFTAQQAADLLPPEPWVQVQILLGHLVLNSEFGH